MDKIKLREIIITFLTTTKGFELEQGVEKLIEEIELEHLKAIRPLCVTLAEIGLGIINDAQDTVWVTNFETAIDRIFNELGIDLFNPKEQLQEFINYEVKTWHEKRLEKKIELPVQLELNLES